MGTYQKLVKATLATTVAFGALFTATPTFTKADEVKVPTFSDVTNIQGNYFYNGVMSLTSREVISGYPDGTFKPFQKISREHTAKILALALELDLENVEDPKFTDVPKNHPYYAHIAALVEAGVIKGYDNKTFNPSGLVTRAQMAKMITNGFGFDELKYAELPFTDITEGHWAADFVQTLFKNEITTGTTPTTFGPEANLTRGQVATFIFRSELEIGGIKAEDFGPQSKTSYTAGASLTEGKTLSDVASLTVEWFDNQGTSLGKGTLTDKLASEFPKLTQLSMPFDANFNYVTDGYWSVVGKFTGEPTKVAFNVTYKNGDKETAENTRTLSGGIVAQDFGPFGETGYTAGASFTEDKAFSDVKNLTVEWFDVDGKLLGKGTATDKFATDFPTATQISMPFDVNFNYLADGYWTTEGKFIGVPTSAKFTVTYKTGKEASVVNSSK